MDKQKLDLLIKWYDEVYFYAMRKMKIMLEEELSDTLTSEQYFTIQKLKMYGPCLPSELAEHMDVNRSAITAMIDRLVAKGYVERIRNEHDRRNVLLRTTSKGDEVFSQGQEKIYYFMKSLMDHFSDEEINTFMKLYEKIATVIQN